MKKIIMALLGALMLLAPLALPASATPTPNYKVAVDSDEGIQQTFVRHSELNGRMTWSKTGDWIWTKDTVSNGMSFGVEFQTNNGVTGLCRDMDGAAANWYRRCGFNGVIPENTTVRFRLGSCGGSKADCDEFDEWYWGSEGWSGWIPTS